MSGRLRRPGAKGGPLLLGLVMLLAGAAPGPAAERRPAFRESGPAAWYGPGFIGQRTASGALYDPKAFTAAHPTLPFGTRLWVTNNDNGRAVMVTVNDRCGCPRGIVIDLSEAAARAIGLQRRGTSPVRLKRAD